MSYILEALKKAEREREVGTVPSLGALRESSPPPVRIDRSLLLLSAAGLSLAVVVAMVSWLQHDRGVNPTTPPALTLRPASPSSSAEAPYAKNRDRAAPPADSESESEPAGARGVAVQPSIARPGRASSGSAAPVALHSEPLAPLRTMVPQRSRPRPAPEPSREAASRGPRVPPAVAMVPAVPSVNESVMRPTLDGLPLLVEMSPEFQSAVPELGIDVHVFSDNPARSFLILNGRKYREGDDLGRGASLVAITAEGAVIDYRNERFRVPY